MLINAVPLIPALCLLCASDVKDDLPISGQHHNDGGDVFPRASAIDPKEISGGA